MPPRPSPPRLTHFLCLPLITPTSRPQLQASLSKFKDTVTTSKTRELPDGIPEKAIRPLGTLHLTLGVMSLLTPERVDSALKLLKELDLSILLSGVDAGIDTESEVVRSKLEKEAVKVEDCSRDKRIGITLTGLESMHLPSSTSILYVSPASPKSPWPTTSSVRLHAFALALRNIFSAAGLLVPDTRPLILHATIVNTVYVPSVRKTGGGHGKNKAKLTLDASAMLEDWADYVWMQDVRLEKVAICKMGARATGEGGEYVVEGEIDMPI